ncbi:MAG: hypothetical protein JXR76_18935 [Deltaproteobacteria bacterium]|nr:hypothetical protein [Deltaproteobacteria bacterium]
MNELKDCKCIRGPLNITTEYLETIELPNLEYIAGDIWFMENQMATRVSMPALREIQGSLWVWYSEALTEVSMPQLEKIHGSLFISHEHSLENLSFPSLSSIADLIMYDCEPLSNLDGLSSLKTVGTQSSEYAVDLEKTTLENLNGLAGVTALTASVSLVDNPYLTDVSGLMNISSFDLNDSDITFQILDNAVLPTCEALKLRDALNPQESPVCIMDNSADDCESDYSGC